jgi:hypothetical protein
MRYDGRVREFSRCTLIGQNSLMRQCQARAAPGSFDCVVVRCANANSGQDDSLKKVIDTIN